MTEYLENNATRALAPERYVIYSAAQSDVKHVRAALKLHNVSNKELSGQYKGKPEVSWIVNIRDWKQTLRVAGAFIDREATVLFLGKVNRARDARPAVLFHQATREPEFIGWFFAVSKETALQCEAWTFDGRQYYTTAMERDDLPEGTFYNPPPIKTRSLYPEVNVGGNFYRYSKAYLAAAARRHTSKAYGPDTAAMRAAGYFEAPAKRVAGFFNKAGLARTPSGHEF